VEEPELESEVTTSLGAGLAAGGAARRSGVAGWGWAPLMEEGGEDCSERAGWGREGAATMGISRGGGESMAGELVSPREKKQTGERAGMAWWCADGDARSGDPPGDSLRAPPPPPGLVVLASGEPHPTTLSPPPPSHPASPHLGNTTAAAPDLSPSLQAAMEPQKTSR
jgi:hypothetical protein